MNHHVRKAALAACLAITVLAPVAAYAKHHHYFARVEVMRSTIATMKDGTRLHVQVVKMNGHMMVRFRCTTYRIICASRFLFLGTSSFT